ncbi:MAG TPA: 3-dehydroquinate synthase [Planctomycetota bacterium]|jgi:3-dehydroquinate synthase|nr:MAG: 3-dehydroquinate synthase [Planctomycetes bacterium ADurb.Bin069]HNR97956.1 3-dehydroquinate synthase [Planctomycetota bacterium]HNU24518.1 3-dehydroquinate synthase [Planctomycetota bacterium]HOE29092.1 3-dehydroquinate synthase [Planctomycetota bacterium]HOE86013.1 3-dehydroquinate synthase [Planctomycetota bacterium]
MMRDALPPSAPHEREGVVHERFTVEFDYPVWFTRDVFAPGNRLFPATLARLGEPRRHRVLLYLDSNVAAAHPGLAARIAACAEEFRDVFQLAAPPAIIPGGACAKSEMEVVRDIMTTIGALRLDRQSFVAAVGGGAVLDVVGFAASLVHRGLRFVRLPSTTLAQGDAGIGVKNGMDIHGRKNFAGTFAPPFAVLNDFALLPTLTDRDWIGGVAEAFKVAIIKDAEFFDFLARRARDLRGRDQAAMETTVRRCAEIHLEHIRTAGDPFELGSARPLDFGHWAGHQLEVMTGGAEGHGQAVAAGIALDSYYAMRTGRLTPLELDRILAALRDCGLPVYHPLFAVRQPDGGPAVFAGLEQLREHLGGLLTITLPDGIGRKVEVHTVDLRLYEEGIGALEELARA